MNTKEDTDQLIGKYIYYLCFGISIITLGYISIYKLLFVIFSYSLHLLLKASGSKFLFTTEVSYGNSMKPAIPHGMKVNIVIYPYNLSEEDVVFCKYKGYLIQHRIINVIDENTYVIQGDNNTNKETITSDQILGKQIQINSQLLFIPISPIAITETLTNIKKYFKTDTQY